MELNFTKEMFDNGFSDFSDTSSREFTNNIKPEYHFLHLICMLKSKLDNEWVKGHEYQYIGWILDDLDEAITDSYKFTYKLVNDNV